MKPIILVDPFPRTMELIFTKDKLNYLKSNYKLIKRYKQSQKKIFIIKIFLMQNLLLDNQHLKLSTLKKAKN